MDEGGKEVKARYMREEVLHPLGVVNYFKWKF